MNVTSKFQSILPSLAEKALTSPINYKLSAGILKGGRLVRAPSHNTHCTVVRGCRCSSLHAEHSAILQAFPSLTYSRAKGWYFLRSKGKGTRRKKGQKEEWKV
jgi:hypothetical protein